MSDQPDNANVRCLPEDADLFLVDRETLLWLIEILKGSAPHLEVQVEPSPRARISLVDRSKSPAADSATERDVLPVARDIYWSRRRRDQRLQSDLFGEPAWDILLDLFIAQATGKRTTLTSACVASAVPATTAQRWIRELEARHLVRREGDPEDARRVYVDLTDEALTKLRRLLREIAPCRA